MAVAAAAPAHAADASPALVEAALDQLASGLLESATFLMERAYALEPTEGHALLLATCHMRAAKAYRAHHVLRGCTGAPCRYLFARASFDLGRYAEAEAALLDSYSASAAVAGGAKGHHLLGEVCVATDRHDAAIRWFASALRLDPYLWCAFERLCSLGADEEAAVAMANAEEVAVPLTPSLRALVTSQGHAVDAAAAALADVAMAESDDGMDNGAAVVTPAAAVTSGYHLAASATPATGGRPSTPATAAAAAAAAAPHATSAKSTVRRGMSAAARTPATPATPTGTRATPNEPPPPPRRRPPTAPSATAVRRSSRLTQNHAVNSLNQPQSSSEMTPSGAAPPTPGRPDDAGEAYHGTSSVRHPAHGGHREAIALLRSVADGVRALAAYRCAEAEAALKRLPAEQLATAYVQCALGRCCFELGDYAGAAARYAEAFRSDPTRLEGVDVYSTALWHLRRDVELSHLAQRCVALDRWSPYAWCAAGNCMSQQREHEAALRLFRRAIQLMPSHAYAHTLCGHERLAVEDLEGAMQCYRTALRYDSRHYNAWYGLGQCYLRQEKVALAEVHLRRALEVNPRSSVLCCHMGVALAKLGRAEEALAVLDAASLADPSNPLARFEKAQALLGLGRAEEAVEELEVLRDGVAPNEAQVYFLLGRAYRRLGRGDVALGLFTTALDLKPSSAEAALIRSAIDGTGEEEL